MYEQYSMSSSTNIPSCDGWSRSSSSFQTHPEWGILKKESFHALTLKHQRDLENLYQANRFISDFCFWQANLGGCCMADMAQKVVTSPDGTFPLVRRVVNGAPHPGRRKKKKS